MVNTRLYFFLNRRSEEGELKSEVTKMDRTARPFRFRLNRKGQTLVEFAFVFLIFIVLICMLSGLTQIAYNWIVLQYAVSDASRFGSLGKIDVGFNSREASIRNRVVQTTGQLGLNSVSIEFFDQVGGSTAGSSSEYFKMKVSRTIQLKGMVGFFLSLAGFSPSAAPIYQVNASTVIRNEPF